MLPILIHGDASLAGQGIVYETVQMCKLGGYYTGGTIHFVINNQIGFTTDFDDARSADYCTSLAAMVQSPVLHVNGDDPEAVVNALKLLHAIAASFIQMSLLIWFAIAGMDIMKVTIRNLHSQGYMHSSINIPIRGKCI